MVPAERGFVDSSYLGIGVSCLIPGRIMCERALNVSEIFIHDFSAEPQCPSSKVGWMTANGVSRTRFPHAVAIIIGLL